LIWGPTHVKSLSRLLKYVLAQWPRVITVVLSAMVVSALLSLSFVTVIPLLKVMMGDEGLHGWVDRKVVSHRYGLEFYVPGNVDFMQSDIAHHLLVTDVKDASLGEKAGLAEFDRVVGVGGLLIESSDPQYWSLDLLEELATAPDERQVTLQVRRADGDGAARMETLLIETGDRPFYLSRLERLMSFVPREQTRDSKTKAVIFIVLGVGVITVVRCAAKFVQEYLAQKTVQVAISDLREDAYAHVLEMPIGYFAGERPSDSVSRIIRDTSVMRKAIKIMLGKAIREPLNALFLLLAALWLDWKLTLVFTCGVPFVVGLLAVLGKKMRKATRKSLMVSSEMLGKLQEALASVRVIKVYNQYEYENKRFRTVNRRFLKQVLKMSKVEAATQPIMEVLGMAAGSAALVIGAQWVTGGSMDGTEFLGLLILLGCAAEAARKTGDIWPAIQEAEAAAERIFGLMDSPTEYEKPDAQNLAPLNRGIEFRDVVFTYPRSSTPALRGVNLSISAGHNVAIVGGNGSGKTTLMNLVPRFYNPDSGCILIDGVDIRDVRLRSLRDQIAMVTQNVVTFNDTVAANIAYGRLDATRQEITEAAHRAYVHEFVDTLPDGYDTMIGEHGSGFSGGQLQRIVIARAILKNPAILIFDEATSQVDADSEAKIHKAIEEMMHDRTSFIIAHRFSTVISADLIVVIDQGRIVAQGRHEELIKNCPLYQTLYKTQLMRV